MTDSIRVLVAVALVGAVAMLAITFVRSLMGKAVRGTLHVPQGKNRIELHVRDDSKLRPYKFGQTFEAEVTPDEEDGIALRYKGTTIGSVDGSLPYAQALRKLASTHARVLVPATVLALDEQQRPIVQALLPHANWFKRALS